MAEGKHVVHSAPPEAAPKQADNNQPEGPSPGRNAWNGAELRRARELSGVSIEELSSRTKINIAILRALEEERFEDTPKARVYVRGFVRCMAKEIGVDPEAVAQGYVPRWERWFSECESEF